MSDQGNPILHVLTFYLKTEKLLSKINRVYKQCLEKPASEMDSGQEDTFWLDFCEPKAKPSSRPQKGGWRENRNTHTRVLTCAHNAGAFA